MEAMDLGSKRIGLLGKMPDQGDFVRFNATGLTWRAFDTWIQEGFYLAHQQDAFRSSYQLAEGYAFLYTPANSQQALLGYMQPSQDRIGRKFPLIIARETTLESEPHRYRHTIPVRYGQFIEQVRELAHGAATGVLNRTELLEALESVVSSPSGEGSYETFLNETPWRSVAESLWSQFEDPRKFLLFKNLNELVRPLKAGVPDQYALGFRFPACDSSLSPSITTAMWLDIFFRALGDPEATPSFFWRENSEKKNASSVLLFLRPPLPGVLLNMIPNESESDHICDMDQIGSSKKDQAANSLSEGIRALLESFDASVADVRSQVGI